MNQQLIDLLIRRFEPTCDQDCHQGHFDHDLQKAVADINKYISETVIGADKACTDSCADIDICHHQDQNRLRRAQRRAAGITVDGEKA